MIQVAPVYGNLNYTQFQTQKYLLSGNISTRSKKLLFKAGTRMLKVGDNFGKKEELCPLCLLEYNTQSHLVECVVIKMHSPDIFVKQNQVIV